ncbi:MAG: Cna B-type domain-containing protein, partial [Clostridia bacterium]|nr:Cna B-type domain-containing protein [Clostridia bacterium]
YVKTVTGASSWTATTNSSGIAAFSVKLPMKNASGSYITYKIEEATPQRYNTVSAKTFTFSGIAADGTKSVPFENTLKKQSITVNKVSDDGNVSGVTFKLTFTSEALVKKITGLENGVTMTTDSTGKINFGSKFPVYNSSGGRITYRITELENKSLYKGLSADTSAETGFIEKGTASDGTNPYVRFYLADDAGATANFTSNFGNDTFKASAQVQKTSEDDVKAGFKFTLTPNTDSDYVKKVTGATSWIATTNSSGIAAFNVKLPMKNLSGAYITYKITETTPQRYNTVSAKTFTFSGIAANGTKSVPFENTLKKQSISVVKTSDDGNVMGVKFRLEFNNIELVEKISGVKNGTTGTTDSAGKINFGSKFPVYNAAGTRITYKITELEDKTHYTGLNKDTSSETGFIESGTATDGSNAFVRFYLANDTGTTANFTSNFENHTHTGKAKVIKTSEDKGISGITFTLTATSDTEFVKTFSGNTTWEAKTNSSGEAVFNVELPMKNKNGTFIKYRIEEKAVAEKYNKPSAVDFDFTGISKGGTKSISFNNTLAKGNIEIEKKQAWDWTEEKTFLITGNMLTGKALGSTVNYYEKKTHKKLSATGILVTTGKKYKYDYATGKVTESGSYAANEHKVYISGIPYSTDISVTEIDITPGENDKFQVATKTGLSLRAGLKDSKVTYDANGVPTLKLTGSDALVNHTTPFTPVVPTGIEFNMEWIGGVLAVGLLVVLIAYAKKRKPKR